MKPETLKPCPWDMKIPTVKGYKFYDYEKKRNAVVWIVRCKCGVQKEGTTEKRAIAAWNRRQE